MPRRGPVADADLGRQREVVDAFLAAAREGDFEALLEVLDPDVVLRADRGACPRGASREVHGAEAVAEQAGGSPPGGLGAPGSVNGAAGFVVVRDGRPFAVAGFTVSGGGSSRSTSSPTPTACARST